MTHEDDDAPLLTFDEAVVRIEQLLDPETMRAEQLEKVRNLRNAPRHLDKLIELGPQEAAALEAALTESGKVPWYYGQDATPASVYQQWIEMARNCHRFPPPQDMAWYEANAIGWASRD